MGEIDHADNAIDHGVADGDQAVDRAEYEAVDQLLGEIIHALPYLEMTRRWPPAALTDASYGFLQFGTGGGNSAGCGLNGLYRASFWAAVSQSSLGHNANTALPRNHPAGTGVPSQPKMGGFRITPTA